MSKPFSYDVVPYPGGLFGQTHPDVMATGAAYLGMEPADPEHCRVLELGCGDGSNLLAFASALPESKFVGIDLSELHIVKALDSVATLDLKNISFEQKNVMDLDRESIGEFDFIIAHGLYSWVPNEVREKVLQIYAESLTPNGVGFISFNAYPGYKISEMFRDMMRFHTRDIDDPMEKVRSGVGLLKFLSESTEPNGLSQFLYRSAFHSISERHPQNVFHDEFASINQAFYLHEFVDHLKLHRLQFLSESAQFSTARVAAETSEAIASLGLDDVGRQQYLDFVACRSFRNTLICKNDVILKREPTDEIVKNFFIASPFQPSMDSPDTPSQISGKFVGPSGESIEINQSLTAAALTVLSHIWRRALSLDELLRDAQELLGKKGEAVSADDTKLVAGNLLGMYQLGLIEFHRYRAAFNTAIPEFPRITPLARWQLANEYRSLTTAIGLSFELSDDLTRLLLILLDGTHDRAALIGEIQKRVQVPDEMRPEFENQLPGIVDFKLASLAECGMLTE